LEAAARRLTAFFPTAQADVRRRGNNSGSVNLDEGDLEPTKHVRRQILGRHEWLGLHSTKPTLSPSLSLSRHSTTNQQESAMLQWALIFFVVSLIAGFFGFSGVSAATAGIAKILFYIAIVVFIIFLVLALMGGALVL